jgi:uncharacterized protein YdhG (YjbR/CyaY superfamily)
MPTVDEYLQNITPTQRAQYKRIRTIVKKLIPDAEEVISYGIPTFKHKGTYVIYFGAYKHHMSVYPGTSRMDETLGEEFAKFRTSKGTLQFTSDNPIPESLLKKMIQIRLEDIAKN